MGNTTLFKGLGNLANLGSILKQAQQMGARLQQLGAEMKAKRATGSAGGGMVVVEVNGLGEVLSVKIDPDLFAKQDREMIEDLIPAAINQAAQKARQMHAEAMQQMTGGVSLPAGLEEMLSELGDDQEED